MMRSAPGTYSFPSACMKSYWVSTSQKMTRGMAGNLSEDVGGCQQARRTDAQTHRGKQTRVDGNTCSLTLFIAVRLCVQLLPCLYPQHHRYFVTAVLPWTARAIRPHLERELLALGRHETELQEECGLARQGQHLVQPLRVR